MKLYTSPDLVMVTHIKNILESHGIHCFLQNQFSSAAVGEIPPIECWPELCAFDQSKVEKAKRIIQDSLNNNRLKHPSWRCNHCNEQIEGQFTACWKCGTDRKS